MAIIEAYKKSQEAREEQENPKNPTGPTLKAIIGDTKKSALFGSFLQHEGGKSVQKLVTRLFEGNLSEGDIAELAEYRTAFVEKIGRAEAVSAALTVENINQFASNSKELTDIINTIGADRAVAVVKGQIEKLVIEDEEQFELIASNLGQLQYFQKGEMEETNNKIRGYLAKYKIDEQSYVRILQNPNMAARLEELSELIHSKMSRLGKVFDFFSGRSMVGARIGGAEDNKVEIELAIEQLNFHMQSVGEALALTVDQNSDVRHALSQELIGEKPEKEKKTGFKEMKGGMPDGEAIDEAWDEYKTGVTDWATLSSVDQDAQRELFRKKYQKETLENNEFSGFWASFFKSFFSSMMKKKSLK